MLKPRMRMRGFQDLRSGYNNPVRGEEHKDTEITYKSLV
jgi:hypothetical protein